MLKDGLHTSPLQQQATGWSWRGKQNKHVGARTLLSQIMWRLMFFMWHFPQFQFYGAKKRKKNK